MAWRVIVSTLLNQSELVVTFFYFRDLCKAVLTFLGFDTFDTRLGAYYEWRLIVS